MGWTGHIERLGGERVAEKADVQGVEGNERGRHAVGGWRERRMIGRDLDGNDSKR